MVNKHLIKQYGPYTAGVNHISNNTSVRMKGRIQKGRPSGGAPASPTSSSLTRMLTSTNNNMQSNIIKGKAEQLDEQLLEQNTGEVNYQNTGLRKSEEDQNKDVNVHIDNVDTEVAEIVTSNSAVEISQRKRNNESCHNVGKQDEILNREE